MVQIGDTIVGLDVLKVKFTCDLLKCKGACCIHGDSGAPLEEDEAVILEEMYPEIKPYMSPKGIKSVDKHGPHMIDSDGDLVTVLIDKKECAFVTIENDIAKCSIEKAYFDGKISFRKPVSCHLYPVRVKSYRDFKGVNYDRWDICKDAIVKGREMDMPLFIFLKESFIRKFGKEWYKELELVHKELKDTDKPDI